MEASITSGAGLHGPADAVLDLRGGVRLGEHLGEEELDEAGVVAPPVVTVELGPAFVAVEHLVERGPVLERVGWGDEGNAHRERDDARHPLRWSAANHSDRHTPSPHRPISTADSGQVAASTASRSATHASSVWASGVTGRSERPLPRPSKVTTR
jgi:hypothetical protein